MMLIVIRGEGVAAALPELRALEVIAADLRGAQGSGSGGQ
jgi:hypothetical protein